MNDDYNVKRAWQAAYSRARAGMAARTAEWVALASQNGPFSADLDYRMLSDVATSVLSARPPGTTVSPGPHRSRTDTQSAKYGSDLDVVEEVKEN